MLDSELSFQRAAVSIESAVLWVAVPECTVYLGDGTLQFCFTFYQVKSNRRQGAIFNLITFIVIFIKKKHCCSKIGSAVHGSVHILREYDGFSWIRSGNSSFPLYLSISLKALSFWRKKNGSNSEPQSLTLSDISFKSIYPTIISALAPLFYRRMGFNVCCIFILALLFVVVIVQLPSYV